MRWPWTKAEPEKRESLPFTDAVVAALAAQAAGQSVGDPGAIAALEAATALYARAFASARMTPPVPALSPSTMTLIARNLIRRSEDVHLIQVRGDAAALIPCGSWDVRGAVAGVGMVVQGGHVRTVRERYSLCLRCIGAPLPLCRGLCAAVVWNLPLGLGALYRNARRES